MKEWWLNLSLHEKRMVSLGLVVILAGLFYALIWSPLHASVASLRDQLQHNQSLLSWMQTTDEQIQAIEKTGQKPRMAEGNASHLSLVQDSLKQSPIADAITQLVQTDKDSVKLNFQKVNFDALIAWLTDLWQQQGLVVTQLSIKPGDTPGIVTADFVLI